MMKLLHIYTNDDSILKQTAKPVKDFSEENTEMRDLAKNMFYTMKMSKGIGLAAPQVGQLLRIITMDTTAVGGKFMGIMINPEILSSSGSTLTTEGCLSFPGQQIKTQRSAEITLKFQDFFGNTVTKKMSNIDAVCVLHEIDHLQGITFQQRRASE